MDILDQADEVIEITLANQITDVRRTAKYLPTTGFVITATAR